MTVKTMPTFDVSPEVFGAYIQKVDNLEQSMLQLARNVDRGFDNVRTENKAALDNVNTSIKAIADKLDIKSQPQYSLLMTLGMLLLTAIGGLGTVIYVPMKGSLDATAAKLDTEISRAASHEEIAGRLLELKSIIDQRLDESGARRNDWQMQSEKRDDEVKSNMAKLMPRQEEELRWHWVEKEFDGLRSKPKG